MAIDTSIYNNIKQFEAPNFAEAQGNAMKLSQMQLQNEQAVNKMQTENRDAKFEQAKRAQSIALPHMDALAGMPESQRAQAFPQVMKELENQGLPMQNIPKDEQGNYVYDPQHFQQSYSVLKNTDLGLARQKLQGDINSAKNDPIDRDLARGKTRAETAKLYAEASKERGGKPLAAEQSDKLAGHDASLHMIGDLRSTIASNSGDFGPIRGRIASLNPYDQRGQEVSALFKKGAQTIGKSLEGGKLTDQDYAKYQKMLPNQSDLPEVANAKLDQLERMVMSQRNSDLTTYGNAGSNVKNFSLTRPTDIDVARPKNNDSSVIPSAQADDGEKKKAPKPDVREVSGKKYVKVKGGWEEVK